MMCGWYNLEELNTRTDSFLSYSIDFYLTFFYTLKWFIVEKQLDSHAKQVCLPTSSLTIERQRNLRRTSTLRVLV